MNHYTVPRYWSFYKLLPVNIQKLADNKFELLKEDASHPSLHLKQIKSYWSVRVGIHYRALGVDSPSNDGILWIWIGTHEEYNNLIKR